MQPCGGLKPYYINKVISHRPHPGEELPEPLVPSLTGGIVGLGRESSASYALQLLLNVSLQLRIIGRCVTVSFHVAKLLPFSRSQLGDFLQKLGDFLQNANIGTRTFLS